MERRALACPQKKAEQEKRQIVFVDESGFYLLPMAVRTYAPVGKTPVLRVPLTYDYISAIGALTPEGRLFMQTQERSYKRPDVVDFLRLLLREIPGKLLIIWDGSTIHRCQAVKDFLAEERCCTHSPGTFACLCTRVQSSGRRLEPAQTP